MVFHSFTVLAFWPQGMPATAYPTHLGMGAVPYSHRDSLDLAPKGSINQIAVLCRGEAWGRMGLKNKAHLAACSEWAAALSTTGIVPTCLYHGLGLCLSG